MSDDAVGEITTLLQAVRNGDPGASDRLISLVYTKLRQIARNRVGSDDLEPTALVHEAYLKLFGKGEPAWENRNHFFWAAARAMRDIMIDRARRRAALRRGGAARTTSLDDDLPCTSQAQDLLALDEAIQRLEAAHPLAARIVVLRFFAGLTREQVSDILRLSETAVWREWNFAKAWLLAELDGRSPVH